MWLVLDAPAGTLHERCAMHGQHCWRRCRQLPDDPVARVWLHLKSRFLSLRLLNDYKAIVTAAARAWRRLRRTLDAYLAHVIPVDHEDQAAGQTLSSPVSKAAPTRALADKLLMRASPR